jgi:two-component system, sensor histidine kinase
VPLVLFSWNRARMLDDSDARLDLTRLGNVTVLERPVRTTTLISAVKAGLRARRRQYQVRTLLAQLENRVRERDQFLAMLGHELRNPLGAILMATEVMVRKDPEAMPRERAIVERQTRNLCRLVDDLLEVSRVTSGKIALHSAPVDLAELADRCVQSLRAHAREAAIDLTLDVGGGALFVEGDAVRLEQVVMNLLGNALKYTPSGGRVAVTVERTGEHVELRVADDGIGIDPEVLPRIFELFVQAEGNLDRASGGMGIGLTLVRALVALHGGSVSASSPGRGKGSEFTVVLPLSTAASPPREAPAAEHPPAERRRVVIVEDNRDVREPLQILLDEAGHEVEVADDGERGVELIVSSRPDVALIDIGLPLLDGYEVARRVRQRLGGAVLLVALSGYGQPEDRRRALAAGFDAHLTKPVQIAALEGLFVPLPSR